MKILFLDIDGVLNDFDCSHLTKEERQILLNKELSSVERQYVHLNEKLVQRLNNLIRETDCKIVLSSAWRNWHSLDEMHEMLCKRGFAFDRSIFIGKTENFKGYCQRGLEILKYLFDLFQRKEEMPESFAIVDDMQDMNPLLNFLVQTDEFVGISNEDVENLKNLLNNPKEKLLPWSLFFSQTCGMHFECVGSGWHKIVQDLFWSAKHIDPDFSFSQVKEKFGLLRAYANSSVERVYELCWKAEDESKKHCEECGSTNPILKTDNNGYWIRNLCQPCRDLLQERKDARAKKISENKEKYKKEIEEINRLYSNAEISVTDWYRKISSYEGEGVEF